MPDTVDTPSLAYNDMSTSYWGQIEALRGGTKAMRDAGATYLPMHAKEEIEQWKYRRDRTFLFPAYDNAIGNIVSKPFQKPVSLASELPLKLQPLEEDMDLNGRNLTTFAKEVFDAGSDYGLTHLFVDFPATGGGLSLGDEAQMEIRPTIVHYRPTNILGWKTERGANGQTVLTEVRIYEVVTEPDGDYGEKEVEYVRVVRPTEWERWAKNQQGNWFRDDGGQNSFGSIPLVTFYTNRTGFMTGKPPLWGLSDLNVQHWQVASDYGNIVHVVMSPVIKVTGADEEQVNSMTFGANRLLVMPDGSDAEFLEHSGTSVQSGRDELTRIEERMRALSMEPYLSDSGVPTATGRAIDESKSQAAIQAWIRALENALEDAFGLAAKWTKETLPDDFGVDVFNEFTISLRGAEDADAITKDWQAGLIDQETALREKIRRGQYSDTMDIEEVMRAVEREGPSMASFMQQPPTEEEDQLQDEEEGKNAVPAELR